mgnify:CR=1 FL=1
MDWPSAFSRTSVRRIINSIAKRVNTFGAKRVIFGIHMLMLINIPQSETALVIHDLQQILLQAAISDTHSTPPQITIKEILVGNEE